MSPIACSIASERMAVSKALSTAPDSTTGEMSENSLSCIPFGLRSRDNEQFSWFWP